MYLLSSCLTLLFFFSSFSALSQISVENKAHQILKTLQENHLKPKDVNDAFAKNMHEVLLAKLDDGHLFFTSEDHEKLKAKSIYIDDDINNKQANYLSTLKEIWRVNITKISDVKADFFRKDNDPIPILNVPPNLMKEVVNESNLELKWRAVFRNDVLSELLENFEGKEKPSKDEIKFAMANVSSLYDDYLTNLNELDFLENLYLNALANTFDPHTNYFTYSESKRFEEELSSERSIFGISYRKTIDGKIKITEVYPGSAAWLSGEVHEGDVVRRVRFGNGRTISLIGKTAQQLSKLFDKHYDESEITLFLGEKNGDERSVVLVRSKVYSDSDIIKSAILEGDKKIGYISLPDFYTSWDDQGSSGCANDLAKTLIKLKREGIEGLIFDLRDNGGGSLGEAIDLAGTFIDFGPLLLYKDTATKPHTLKDFNRGAIYNGPLIVLVNEASASASEVVSGALQDYNRALIVGRRTFGKATGQGVVGVAPESLMQGSDQANEWGFLWVTNIGLYRINLATNQIDGIQPDIFLKSPITDEFFREESYKNVIKLPAIEKKMYYTPKPKIDVETLRKLSEERLKSSSFNNQLIEKRKAFVEKFESVNAYNLSWNEFLEFEQYEQKFREELEEVYNNIEVNYTAKSAQYDDEVYRMDQHLNMYKESFLKKVKTDVELSETYNIMLDYLKGKE